MNGTLRHMGLTLKQMIDVPPMWLLGFAIAVWALGKFAPMPLGSGALWFVGTALVGAGIIIILAAAVQFRRHQTTIIPHQMAKHLLTDGLFGWSRNPIYVADAVILAGLCLRWDVVQGLLLVPIFVWIIRERFIVTEEARLKSEFGAAFDSYARKVRRWM